MHLGTTRSRILWLNTWQTLYQASVSEIIGHSEFWQLQRHRRFIFNPSGLAPLVTEPMTYWLQNYFNDPKIRKDYFIPDTELLKDPNIKHNSRTWHQDRTIATKSRLSEIISHYHDMPSTGHCGVNQTVCMIRLRYRFDHMRQRVCRYCKTCVSCQQAKAPITVHEV